MALFLLYLSLMRRQTIILTATYIGLVAVLSYLKPTQDEPLMVSIPRGIAPAAPSPRIPLSKHDKHIEEVSKAHEVDWRFTSALIFVESSFNDKAKSHAGALGLMQVMPIVYRELNSPIEIHPETNINVGLTYFKKLYGTIQAKSGRDRFLMTLAAYNAGLGHLRDAQRIARAKGLDPHAWSALRTIYPKLENPNVYQKTLHGYCQGQGVVTYAEKILNMYKFFKDIYPM